MTPTERIVTALDIVRAAIANLQQEAASAPPPVATLLNDATVMRVSTVGIHQLRDAIEATQVPA